MPPGRRASGSVKADGGRSPHKNLSFSQVGRRALGRSQLSRPQGSRLTALRVIWRFPSSYPECAELHRKGRFRSQSTTQSTIRPSCGAIARRSFGGNRTIQSQLAHVAFDHAKSLLTSGSRGHARCAPVEFGGKGCVLLNPFELTATFHESP